MHVRLAYGKSGLLVHLPDDLDVTLINPRFVPGINDSHTALLQAISHPYGSPPLDALVKTGAHVGIIFSDITRPTPNHLIIPAILAVIAPAKKPRFTLFNACGTHRTNTTTELREILGERLFNEYPVVQNDAFHPETQISVGKTTSGNEIWINRELMDCDIKILTGFIEPHFFAGFSGGGKAIMPGMAGLQTILRNHNALNIGSSKATWGSTQGNPIYEEVKEAAQLAGQVFLVNIALNHQKQITAIFAGDLEIAHTAGCDFVKQTAMVPVDAQFDIAITTNSGYPADLNLYQSVKGMSAAAQVIKEGGSIIIATECWDGIPEHGEYGKILQAAKSPQEILDRIHSQAGVIPDQWQAQIQALIQQKADVYVYSDHLSDGQIRSALLLPCHDIEGTVRQIVAGLDHKARICVLPEGPQAVPYLA